MPSLSTLDAALRRRHARKNTATRPSGSCSFFPRTTTTRRGSRAAPRSATATSIGRTGPGRGCRRAPADRPVYLLSLHARAADAAGRGLCRMRGRASSVHSIARKFPTSIATSPCATGRGSPGTTSFRARFHRRWTQFAATGSPNGRDLPEWPQFKVDAQAVLEFGDTVKVAPIADLARLEFWDAYYSTQRSSGRPIAA